MLTIFYPQEAITDARARALFIFFIFFNFSEPLVDISYGAGTGDEAMSKKEVLCKPLDFPCFFGFSH